MGAAATFRQRIASCVLVLAIDASHAVRALDRTERGSFDIPAQPLSAALQAFTQRTGFSSLVEEYLLEGRRGAPVSGLLTPEEALAIMRSGTGLAFRFVGEKAFTLTPEDSPELQANRDEPVDAVSIAARNVFFSRLQAVIERRLCENEETRPGSFPMAVQLWIASDGKVLSSHILRSTGSASRDAFLTGQLRDLRGLPSPPALSQPVTIVFKEAFEPFDCEGTAARP